MFASSSRNVLKIAVVFSLMLGFGYLVLMNGQPSALPPPGYHSSSAIPEHTAHRSSWTPENSGLTSELSPGLHICYPNPFLIDYNLDELRALDRQWIQWRRTKFVSLFNLLTDYMYSDGVVPEAPEREQPHTLLLSNRVGERIADIFMPSHAPLPCPYQLKTFGSGVGIGKALCGLDKYNDLRARHAKLHGLAPSQQEDCVLFSIGSNNLFSFEESISRDTTCQIYTLDCTSDPPQSTIPRLHFEKRCLGSAQEKNIQLKMFPYAKVPETWGSASQRAIIASVKPESYQSVLDAVKVSHVDVLKFDVEGAEYSIMVDLLRDVHQDGSVAGTVFNNITFSHASMRLPHQLSFESHWWHRDIAHAMLSLEMFEELWRLGYRFMQKETQDDSTCFEWTAMRVYC